MISEFSGKKVFILVAIIVAIFAIPFTIYLSQQNQDTRSRASATPETTVVATVDGQDYTKADVREVAQEQFDPAAIDEQALKDALDVLIERKILDKVATQKGIVVEPSVVETVMRGQDISETQAYYEVLQQEVALSETKSIQVISEGFWSPNSEYLANLSQAEKDLAASQSRQTTAVLSAIQNGLSRGTDPVEVYDSALTSFPVIAPALALNGTIAQGLPASTKDYLALPRVIEYGDSNLDPSVLTGLFAMNVDEVKTFSKTETNNGGAVFKVIKKGNDAGPTTYSAWYTQEKNNSYIPKGSL